MKITRDEARRIAALAHLEFDDDALDRMAAEMTKILTYIDQLREVTRLSNDGVGLAGIKRILELENEVDALRRRLAQIEAERTSAALVVWRPQPRRNL